MTKDSVPEFLMTSEKKHPHEEVDLRNTMSFMQPTQSAHKKQLKIKKKFKPGIDIKIHQYLSISIRKYRYGYEKSNILSLGGIGETMKRMFYSKFKEEIKHLNQK